MNGVTAVSLIASAALVIMVGIGIIVVCVTAIIQHRTGQIGELWKSRYMAMETAHKRDLATSEFLYELLLDLVTPNRDETILYKARCLHVALLLMDVTKTPVPIMDHIRVVLNTPTLKTVDHVLNELIVHTDREVVLEPDTVSAHDKFMELMSHLEREEEAVTDRVIDIEERLGKRRLQREDTSTSDNTVVIHAVK